jgi:hypothetical protein
MPSPDFTWFHPGYEEKQKNRKRNAGRRVPPTSAPCPLCSSACAEAREGARRALKAQRARLPAFHHGACCSERTPQLSSSYALPGTWSERTTPMVRKAVRSFGGRYPLLPVPVQRVASQTGHRVGRA